MAVFDAQQAEVALHATVARATQSLLRDIQGVRKVTRAEEKGTALVSHLKATAARIAAVARDVKEGFKGDTTELVQEAAQAALAAKSKAIGEKGAREEALAAGKPLPDLPGLEESTISGNEEGIKLLASKLTDLKNTNRGYPGEYGKDKSRTQLVHELTGRLYGTLAKYTTQSNDQRLVFQKQREACKARSKRVEGARTELAAVKVEVSREKDLDPMAKKMVHVELVQVSMLDARLVRLAHQGLECSNKASASDESLRKSFRDLKSLADTAKGTKDQFGKKAEAAKKQAAELKKLMDAMAGAKSAMGSFNPTVAKSFDAEMDTLTDAAKPKPK